MSPRERYDAVVQAMRLLKVVYNDLDKDCRTRPFVFVAAAGAESAAEKLLADVESQETRP